MHALIISVALVSIVLCRQVNFLADCVGPEVEASCLASPAGM